MLDMAAQFDDVVAPRPVAAAPGRPAPAGPGLAGPVPASEPDADLFLARFFATDEFVFA